jgi:thiopeptide-type bacteriocin biosynthesis protein
LPPSFGNRRFVQLRRVYHFNFNKAMWRSIHFTPKEEQDIFLVDDFLPFCEQQIWSTRGTRVFFIRYHDTTSGLHLRLRFKGEPDWLDKTLQPAFDKAFKKKGSWTIATYEPETARFGGEVGLAWAEEHFHISSRVALSRLKTKDYTYGDAMFDALRLHLAAAFATGLNKTETGKYFDNLGSEWIKAFFKPLEGDEQLDLIATVRADFEETYRPQSEFLKDALHQFHLALTEERFDTKQPEWLRWLKGNQLIFKEMGPELTTRTLPHLLHLTNNRLGINNQDEAYLLYVLSKVF